MNSHFVTAAPTSAHYALAELENKRIVKHVVTGNGDHLHERAGSRQVHYKSSQHFVGSKEGWGWIAEGEFLLVAGIGRDEHGIISWARDHNIQIVVVSPDIPSFLHAQDWYVDGKAEDVLGQLSQDLPALDVEAVRSPPSCTKG